MKSTSRNILVFLLIAVLLATTGCSPSNVVTALDGIIAAAELLFPLVAASVGVPPVLVDVIENYLQLVYLAVDKTVAILADPAKTSAQKISEIIALFLAVARPVLPKETPLNITIATGAVDASIRRFLTTLNPASVSAPAQISTQGPRLHELKLNSADRASLDDIHIRASENLVKLMLSKQTREKLRYPRSK